MMALAVIFDLDGTLIDSVPDLHAAVAKMLAGEGRAALAMDVVQGFVGHGLPTLVARVMDHCGIDRADHPRLTAATLAHYNADPATLTRTYPGVMAALQALHAAGHPLGLCTNKPEAPARAILRAFGMEALFSSVIGGDTLGITKPDPAPLHACHAALGGGAALYVGDSEVDAATAQAAGMRFALFTEGYRKTPVDQMPHDLAFADFADLPAMVAAEPGHFSG